MANAVPSRVGQNLLAGDVNALFLDILGGEVMTAYEMAVKLRDKVRSRTISGARSARFPAVYKAVGQYHTPGAEITGQAIPHTEVTISVDDLLIADAFVALIDDLKNHYDARGPYAKELGRALALIEDRIISMSILKSARAAELFTGDGGGGSVQETDISGSADFTTSGSDLWAAFGRSVQLMDEKDVPVEEVPVYGAVLPAQWYLMANSTQNLDVNRRGTAGSHAKSTLAGVSGVDVIKSTALLFGRDATPYNAGTNADGLVGSPTAGPKYALPAAFPTKYHADMVGSTGPVGLVWTEAAVARLQLLGLAMEAEWDIRRQGWLLLAKMSVAAGTLRSKCAMEIKKS